MTASNFSFLSPCWPEVAHRGAEAEELFYADPHACLMKLRYFEEALLAKIMAEAGTARGENTLEDMIHLVAGRYHLDRSLTDAMHELRKLGNMAAHAGQDYLEDAERALRIAHRLASWAGKNVLEIQERPTFQLPKPRVTLSWEYQTAFGQLAPEVQQVAQAKVLRLLHDPTDAAIRYEVVPGRRDQSLRTVAAGEDHRIVILRGSRGDMVMLDWIGPTEKALAWARDRQIEVHPLTGAIQFYSLTPLPPKPVDPTAKPLFEAFSDEDLGWLGLPQALLPEVRQLRATTDLERLQVRLPQEAYEALFALAAGETLEAVLDAQSRATEPVDPENFAAALARPDTRRRVVEVHNPEELAEIMKAPLDLWRVFLHPRQEKLVTADYAGPSRVLGGAGTGKTVVLMHRARHLARQVFTAPEDRILILTYTLTLAEDIRDNLETLCGPEFARIDVRHLHGFAREFLEARGQELPPLLRDAENAAWDEALDAATNEELSDKFYRKEWQDVVLAQGIADLDGYLAAPREGRSFQLNEAKRREVWAVFEAYKASLDRRGLRDFAGQLRLAGEILHALPAPPYRAVLVDETQDMGPVEFKLIRALVAPGPNDLFIVGDPYQKIFPRRLVLSEAGMELAERSELLTLNYRTTSQIRDWAVAMLASHVTDDLDGGEATLAGYHSVRSGPVPEVRAFGTLEEETAQIVAHVKQLLEAGEEPESICVSARQRDRLPHYRDALRAAGLPAKILEPYTGDDEPGVVVATMYRIKGLEFKHMAIASVNEGELPPLTEDEPLEPALLRQTQRLLYTTAARARDSLLVTAFGTPSPLLKQESHAPSDPHALAPS